MHAKKHRKKNLTTKIHAEQEKTQKKRILAEQKILNKQKKFEQSNT